MREDEMRNTMSSGTAMIRVMVRPIGKFTLELRRRDESAPPLWVVAHNLVNVGHVAGHERRCVEAQARVHVRGPPRDALDTGRRYVTDVGRLKRDAPWATHVRDVAPARV